MKRNKKNEEERKVLFKHTYRAQADPGGCRNDTRNSVLGLAILL